MDFLVLVFITSLISVAAFSLLLTAEERAGARLVLGSVRRKLDQGLIAANKRFFGNTTPGEVGTVRQTIHFVIHRLIKLLLVVVVKLESALKQVQHMNRKAARVYRKKQSDASNISELQAVTDHAQTIKLSEEEKREKRIEMLG